MRTVVDAIVPIEVKIHDNDNTHTNITVYHYIKYH